MRRFILGQKSGLCIILCRITYIQIVQVIQFLIIEQLYKVLIILVNLIIILGIVTAIVYCIT